MLSVELFGTFHVRFLAKVKHFFKGLAFEQES